MPIARNYIRNIFNAFETLVSEVHQHGTASESSWREKKAFSTDAVAECIALDRCG
jgi:hypothetical protein